jgi:hypothetical protein
MGASGGDRLEYERSERWEREEVTGWNMRDTSNGIVGGESLDYERSERWDCGEVGIRNFGRSERYERGEVAYGAGEGGRQEIGF